MAWELPYEVALPDKDSCQIIQPGDSCGFGSDFKPAREQLPARADNFREAL